MKLLKAGWRIARALPFLSALVWAASAHAGVEEVTPVDTSSASSKLKVSYETSLDYSYIGDARTKLGQGRNGSVSEQSNLLHFVAIPQWNDGPLYRLGLELQRYSFGLPKAAPLPNTLQSLTAIVGVDFSLFDSWLIRIEAQPGFYHDSHDFNGKDFNVPFLIGGSYIASASLQWIAGLSVDVNRHYPVIPAVGVHWTFFDHWTLNAVLPTPRLEYEWQKGLTLYAGGDLKGGTFRLDGDFGKTHGKPFLNSAIVEYDEIRLGGGVTWKVTSDLTLEVEGGYLPYREFNFHRADKSYRTESGAPYGQVSLEAKF